jgi:2-haloacid dehalogenase
MSLIKVLVFDAYGTLVDVHSVSEAADRRFPGRGSEVSSAWRTRQLEYTWLRSLMGRYEDFWRITEEALIDLQGHEVAARCACTRRIDASLPQTCAFS